MSRTVSKESDYRGKQEEVVVLSVIIGEETEVVGVRTCLTWKPLSVLTLMGRPKQGRVRALSLPPAPPVSGTTVALSSAELQSGVWNTLQPPRHPCPDPSNPGAAVSHQVAPPTTSPLLHKPPPLPPPSIRPLLLQPCSLAKLSCI